MSYGAAWAGLFCYIDYDPLVLTVSPTLELCLKLDNVKLRASVIRFVRDLLKRQDARPFPLSKGLESIEPLGRLLFETVSKCLVYEKVKGPIMESNDPCRPLGHMFPVDAPTRIEIGKIVRGVLVSMGKAMPVPQSRSKRDAAIMDFLYAESTFKRHRLVESWSTVESVLHADAGLAAARCNACIHCNAFWVRPADSSDVRCRPLADRVFERYGEERKSFFCVDRLTVSSLTDSGRPSRR